jgi:hypothetical protein
MFRRFLVTGALITLASCGGGADDDTAAADGAPDSDATSAADDAAADADILAACPSPQEVELVPLERGSEVLVAMLSIASDGACKLHSSATFPADTAILFDDRLETEDVIFRIEPLNGWQIESHVDCQLVGADLECESDGPKELVIRNVDDDRLVRVIADLDHPVGTIEVEVEVEPLGE